MSHNALKQLSFTTTSTGGITALMVVTVESRRTKVFTRNLCKHHDIFTGFLRVRTDPTQRSQPGGSQRKERLRARAAAAMVATTKGVTLEAPAIARKAGAAASFRRVGYRVGGAGHGEPMAGVPVNAREEKSNGLCVAESSSGSLRSAQNFHEKPFLGLP